MADYSYLARGMLGVSDYSYFYLVFFTCWDSKSLLNNAHLDHSLWFLACQYFAYGTYGYLWTGKV